MGEDFTDFLGGILRQGISRAADAELTKRFGPSNTTQYYQGEDGTVAPAGTPTVTAPTVTVVGKPLDSKLLIIGAVGLVAVLLLLRR